MIEALGFTGPSTDHGSRAAGKAPKLSKGSGRGRTGPPKPLLHDLFQSFRDLASSGLDA